jgi:hypothetical protein
MGMAVVAVGRLMTIFSTGRQEQRGDAPSE